MPSNSVHRRLAKKLLGVDDRASSIIDAPSKSLGPAHRKIGHTIPSAAKMLFEKGELNSDQLKAAALHIAVDKAASKLSRKQKLMIEILFGGK
jgi:hypothetical protein